MHIFRDEFIDRKITKFVYFTLVQTSVNVGMIKFVCVCYSGGMRKPSGDSEGYTQQEVGVGDTQEVNVTYVKDPSNFQVSTHTNYYIWLFARKLIWVRTIYFLALFS